MNATIESKILVSDANQRITMPQIYETIKFRKDIPLQYGQSKKCFVQSNKSEYEIGKEHRTK